VPRKRYRGREWTAYSRRAVGTVFCEYCGKRVTTAHHLAKYCGRSCQMKAFRARRKYARWLAMEGYRPDQNPRASDGSGGFAWLNYRFGRRQKPSKRDGLYHYDVSLTPEQRRAMEPLLWPEESERHWIHRQIKQALKGERK
jgi:hypothetical protein